MTREQIIEAMARLVHPSVWGDDLPIPTRAATVEFHRGRQESSQRMAAALSAIEALGYVVMPKDCGENDEAVFHSKITVTRQGSILNFEDGRRAMIEAGKV